MSGPYFIRYKGTVPNLGSNADIASDAALIGSVTLGKNVSLGPLVTLRADGHRNDIGDDCQFLDRATVHVADGKLPAIVGHRVTVGRYALVHACVIDDDCLLCDGAVIMDDAHLGSGAVLAAGALVPPGKKLDGNILYAGNPAKPVREISAAEREAWRDAVLNRQQSEDILQCELPPMTMTPFLEAVDGAGPLYALSGASPLIDPTSYVAPNSVVAGRVEVAGNASVWFATVMRAEGGAIKVGARSNIQDNSILVTEPGDGAITIGEDVTLGHNVRMRSCTVGNGCLIGMGCEVMDGVVVEDGAMIGARAFVEPGTVVKAGYIWAGRPAREFRPVKPEEQKFFARGKEVYVGYADTYLAETAAA